jgi:hypothetical protein
MTLAKLGPETQVRHARAKIGGGELVDRISRYQAEGPNPGRKLHFRLLGS